MKPLVSLVKVEGSVEDAVREAVGLLGGIGEFVKPGGSYLVKPNLFTTITADKGATTDPRIFMTLAEMIEEAGAKPVVGECPATGSYARPDVVFDGLGVRELCENHGIEVNVLDRDPPVRFMVDGDVLKELWFPETAATHPIISFPKLKTHQLTTPQRYIRRSAPRAPAPSDQDAAPQKATIDASPAHPRSR